MFSLLHVSYSSHIHFISTLLVFYHTDSNRSRRTAKASTSNIPIGFVAMFAGDLSNASIKSALVAAGWIVLHLTWVMITGDKAAVISVVRAALARARARSAAGR